MIIAASVQDRAAARALLWNLHRACRDVRLVWADAGYVGTLATWAATMNITLQILSKRDPNAFEVLPRRWVVERTFTGSASTGAPPATTSTLPASHEPTILWAMMAS